jgi:bifunctional oligoribonuclease and PAP phosphatase NrnA
LNTAAASRKYWLKYEKKEIRMLARIIELVANCRNFLITSHVRPDGDSIGSELALYLALRGMGKEAAVFSQDGVPETYRFLPGAAAVSRDFGPTESYDALFVLDCSDLGRVGKRAERLTAIKYVISIDHHVTNGDFSDLCILDPGASSTGELVFKLVRELNAPVTPEIATNLYTAILTDTGSFHYSNTGADALKIASELVRAGADPSYIAEQIFESNPPAKARLFARAVQTLKLEMDGRVGSMLVSRGMLNEANATLENTENFVDFVRAIKGVEIALLYTEMEDRFYKVSMRSKGDINVERIAVKFGGGGHVNAAACRITGDEEYVRNRILREITEG